MKAARMTVDTPVEMREEGDRIVAELLQESADDLDRLLDAITPKNLHAEVDFGSPVGKERWPTR
jgi:antitoxin MazE